MEIASAGLSIFTSAAKFGAQKDAARAAEKQGKVEAQQEEIMATQREADRKERLAEAMASQTASAGSRGVFAFEGSPLSVLQEDMRKEEVATDRDAFNARVAGLGSRIRGFTAGKGMRQQATIGLFTDIQDIAKAGMPTGDS